jgi:2-dehydro-3-deoxygalactonokinase
MSNMNPSRPALIALDWGTSSLRAYLMDGSGQILAAQGGPEGIMVAASKGFDTVFDRYVDGWLDEHGNLPVIMSGMIGSQQGWIKAPYCNCPAGLEDIGSRIVVHHTAKGLPVHVVPGLWLRGPGDVPDVMRGEETQLIGCMASQPQDGTFVLPGTHSKWVSIQSARIDHFATFMTGEMYAALKDHTILGRLMTDEKHDDAAFSKGIAWGENERLETGGLLTKLFSVRTHGLFKDIAPTDLAAYLSGLLIGSEIAEVRRLRLIRVGVPVTIVGSDFHCNLYRKALTQCGIETLTGPSDAAAMGLFAIARTGRLV